MSYVMMDTDSMVRILRAQEEKHKNDFTPTFGMVLHVMYHDVAERLEEQQRELTLLKKKFGIVYATYRRKWNNDSMSYSTGCMVVVDTNEVFDINHSSFSVDKIDWLCTPYEEYVVIDGIEHPLSRNGDKNTQYWYK